MSSFTPEQLVEIRQMMAEEVEIAVAAGAGDHKRLLARIPFIRDEMSLEPIANETRAQQLVRAAKAAEEHVNGESAEYHMMMRDLEDVRKQLLGDLPKQ